MGEAKLRDDEREAEEEGGGEGEVNGQVWRWHQRELSAVHIR